VKRLFAGLFVFSVGVFLVGCAVFAALRSLRLLREGIRTAATVVEQQSDVDLTHLVLEFEDAAGEKRRVRLSGYDKPEVGTAVEILYDRRRPEIAQRSTKAGLWLIPVTAGAGGVINVAVGILIWLEIVPLP
jgi:CHASE3 domain sensor protein